MQRELQNAVKSEKSRKDIFDVILYGSFAKGKTNPSDIDIAVIFRSGSLQDRLITIQNIKKNIKKRIITKHEIDIKGILWDELFKPEFFARSGVFIEGISLFDGKPFSEKIGFQNSTLFIYTLIEKSHPQKVKLNYILKGRNGAGMIEKLQGLHLAPGVIQIPIIHTLEFEDILQKQGITFTKKNILIQK